MKRADLGLWTRRGIACLLVLVLGLTMLPVSVLAADPPSIAEDKIMRLWYDEPAAETDSGFESQSLPLGNGYMGVNVFGGTDHELISVTENSMTNGYGPGSSTGPEGDARPRSNCEGLNLLAKTYIDFGHQNVTNYTRDLVLNDAVAHVQYDYNGVTYTREYFTTYPDKVMVMKLSASEPGALTFTLRPTAPFVRDYLTTPGDGKGKTGKVVADTETDDLLTLSGTMNYFNINYEGQYKVIPTGGDMVAANDENGENGTITVTGADSAVILMAVGTNYHMTPEVFTAPNSEKLDPNEYPHDKVSGYIADAEDKGYENLKSAHLSDYQSYFDRAQLDLGGVPSDTVATDQLLANYKNGEYDKYLEELVFQYGRYLLICSSRENCLPPNLQGIWNFYESTPWSGGYWHNINQQMNYWPAFNTNLIDLFEPYADFNEAFRAAAQRNADWYLAAIKSPDIATAGTGENGWAIGTGVWPYSAGGPDATGHSGPGVGAFTSILFWDYYDFTRDETILSAHTYPAIEGMAKFLTKTLKEYEDGKWLVYNSASPENADNYHTIGCAFDQQMVYENHKDVLAAAELLGKTSTDDKLLALIEEQIDHLDPVNIGYSGQVKEYREEKYYGEYGEYQHRHISQLVGLYPGTSITSDTDAWMDAAKITLNYRGDGSTGWSICHRLNAWARVKDGNHSYQVLQKLLKEKLMDNLWDTHPPFQIDGNFGATAGIGEMLLQGHEGYLAPLPALPDAWATGSYQGLTARGAFEVSAWWRDGQATKFTVKSNAGEDCAIQYYNLADATVTDSEGSTVTFTELSQDRISFPTAEGETYTITNIPDYEETAAPSDFQLDNSGTGMELSWTASADAVSYNLYRAINDAPTYELVAEDVKETHYTYRPDDLKDQDRVTMRVTAVAENGRESVGITALSNPLKAPENVTGFFTGTSLQINVPDDRGVDSFCVYQDGEAVVTTAYSVIVIPNAKPDAVYTISAISNDRESEPAAVDVTNQAALENILLNKPLSTSDATVNQSYPLSNAVNGKADSADDRWAVRDQYGAYSVTADLQGTYPLGTLQILEWKSDTLPTRSPSTKVEVLNAEGTWQTIQEGFALQGGEYVSVDMGGVEASKIRITFDNLEQFEKSVCITEMTCSSILPDPVDKTQLFEALQLYGSVDVDEKVINIGYDYSKALAAAQSALLNLSADKASVDTATANLRTAAQKATSLNVLFKKPIKTQPGPVQAFLPEHMVDGDQTTRFAAADDGNSVQATVDLEEDYTLEAFYVQEYLDVGKQTRGQQVTIEVYQNGQWHTVVSDAKLTSIPDEGTHATTEFKLSEPVIGSQVRFTFVNTENKRITIYELQAAGQVASVPVTNYNVTYSLTNATALGQPTIVKEGEVLTATLTAAEGYALPETITVTMDGATAQFTYDNGTGVVTVPNVTGDVVITADGVRVLSSEKAITVFQIEGGTTQINGTEITVTVPYGTDVTSLVPTITVSDKATVDPASGAEQNFTSPVTYTVTAEDGSTKTYTVTVEVAAPDTYVVTVEAAEHGHIVTTPTSAAEGDSVSITVTPDTGYRLKEGSLKAYKTGEPGTAVEITDNAFTMPAYGVTVAAEFEAIEYTVTYNLNGGTNAAGNPATYTVEAGFTLAAPTKTGYTFDGWTYGGVTTPTKDVAIAAGTTGDMTFTAHWTADVPSGGGSSTVSSYTITVTQATGGKISPSTTSVTKGSDKTFTITANEGYKISDVLVDGKSVGAVSSYTFENVTAKHTITAKFEKVEDVTNVGGFIDVKSTDWFAEAVQYAVDNGLMNGTSATTFSPGGDTTRGMIVTILYRQAGSPKVESDGKTWWSDACVWAMANGISDGTNMEKEITREQLATMLYRYAELTGEDVSKTASLGSFQDGDKVSAYAVEALKWAAAEGIVTGKTGGVIDPQAGATRAETATMLMRFCELIK